MKTLKKSLHFQGHDREIKKRGKKEKVHFYKIQF